MLYMFLYYRDPATPPPDDVLERHVAFNKIVRERDVYVASEALGGADAAVTVSERSGTLLTTDGPFAETKEVLGGFSILDCKDLGEAKEFASLMPTTKFGSVEIRPVMQIPDWDYVTGVDRERHPMPAARR